MEFRVISKIFDNLINKANLRKCVYSIIENRRFSSYYEKYEDDNYETDYHAPENHNKRYGQQQYSNRYQSGPNRYPSHSYQGSNHNSYSGNAGHNTFYGNAGRSNSNRAQNFDYNNKFGGNKRRMNNDDIPLVDWSKFEKTPIKKNLYIEPQIVQNRSSEEILTFRKTNEIKIVGENDNLKPILQFSDYEFSHGLQNALTTMKFTAPMPIQSETWPLALSGKDLIGIGQTGSGKTLGYVLPALMHSFEQENKHGPHVLVLAPTRELAQQISTVFKSFSQFLDVRVACLYGGAAKFKQYQELRNNPMIVVATPGRLMDLMIERACDLKTCSYLVLDEADRMLDMGFEPQIRGILRQVRNDRQTLMWSATWPRAVQELARSFSNNPVQITIGPSELSANPNITQEIDFCNNVQKMKRLVEVLKTEAHDNKQKVLIFAEKQMSTTYLSQQLNSYGFHSADLHGGHTQMRRDMVINDFREGTTRICVATDVASRGLDVPDIGLVVNYELPKDIDSYIHRIGRTARAGRTGRALTFFDRMDGNFAMQLIQVLQKSGQPVPNELREFGPSRRY